MCANNIEIINSQGRDREVVEYIKSTSRFFFTPEILEWQYSNKNSFLYLIDHKDQLLGTQGMISFPLIINDELTVQTLKSETTFVSQSLRGSNAFKSLYDKSVLDGFINGSSFIWGFTGLADLWKAKLGFHVDKAIMVETTLKIGFNKVRKPKSILKNLLSLRQILTTRRKIKRSRVSSKLEFIIHTEICKILPEIESKIKTAHSFTRLYLNEEFCRWRIDSNPIINYQLMELIDENEVTCGCILFNIKNDTLNISHVSVRDDIEMRKLTIQICYFALLKKIVAIHFFGNQNNILNKKLINSFEEYGSKTSMNNNMSFVILGKSKENQMEYEKLDNWVINGLWTEGFTY